MCKISLQLLVAVAFATIILCGVSNSTFAQSTPGGISNPYNPKPTVSPYLNLLQNNGNFDFPQYQTLVRPFFDQQAVNTRNNFENQQLRGQVNSLQRQVNRPGMSSIRATGHPTRYMNYSHYYALTPGNR